MTLNETTKTTSKSYEPKWDEMTSNDHETNIIILGKHGLKNLDQTWTRSASKTENFQVDTPHSGV